MEATFKSSNGRLIVKVEGDSQKALFKQLALAQQVFDAFDRCGLCQSVRIHFQVRTVNENDYYELVCEQCQATFSFGQHKVGNTLFPKSEKGWYHWQKENRGGEPDEDVPY